MKLGVEQDDSKARDQAKETWSAALHRSALSIFDAFVEVSADLASPDLRRAVLARRKLQQLTHPTFRKLRKLLGLSVDEPADEGKKRKANKLRKESTT
jgi:hypothetical protein